MTNSGTKRLPLGGKDGIFKKWEKGERQDFVLGAPPVPPFSEFASLRARSAPGSASPGRAGDPANPAPEWDLPRSPHGHTHLGPRSGLAQRETRYRQPGTRSGTDTFFPFFLTLALFLGGRKCVN